MNGLQPIFYGDRCMSTNDRIEPRKWAVFHLYIPIEKAKDADVSRLHEHIQHHYEGKLNYIEDRELSEDTIDTE